MPPWLNEIIKTVYARVPMSARPAIKQILIWMILIWQATTRLRSIHLGRRIQFVGFEIAHLDTYPFLGPGGLEVLVEAEASCVSPGTERAVLLGLPSARRQFPYGPGYSMVGRARKVGREVRGIAEGDLVAGRMPHASRGIMSTNSLFKVPPGVAVEQAAFIELGVITLQGIRKAGIRPGDRVAVVGQGLIGQMAVRLARIVGAGPIVAIASSRRRMSSALATGGADEFVAIADGPDALRAVQADVVIEAVGSSRAIAAAIETARPGGAVVLLGSARDLGRGLDWRTLAQERQIAVIGAHISAVPSRDASSGRWTYAQEGQLFLDLLASRRLDLTSLITWRPTPEECNTVYEVLAEGGREHVGIVFQWGQPGTGNMAGDLQAGRI